MSEPLTVIGLAAIAVSQVGIWIDKLKANRGNGKADKKQSDLCLNHEGRIGELEAGHKYLVDFKKENHQDHLRIFDALGKKRWYKKQNTK